ncbi:Uma2 family endonuclease [Hanamia caeni]|jgi:Uma2 family endonuclease|uniref:Uma2 family endonuclease n=1 Tax=Hanamia caeni TaxID=2294116 RepID=UPI0018F45182|nr:Uma2 family endonuclease [Hanamia caeni]
MQTVFPDIILPLHGLNYDGLSDDEFFEFCLNNTQSRIERDNNRQIILMPPAGALTASFNIRLAAQLELWNQKEKSGITFDSSAGFTLPDDSVFSPDASWMHKEKWERVSAEDKKKFAHVCPDFVIELKSPSDNLKYLKNKMNKWIENGCSLAWLINPEDKIAFIYRKDGTVDKITGFENIVSGEDILPGFELNLSILNR